MSTYGQDNAKVFLWKLWWHWNHEYLAQQILPRLRYTTKSYVFIYASYINICDHCHQENNQQHMSNSSCQLYWYNCADILHWNQSIHWHLYNTSCWWMNFFSSSVTTLTTVSICSKYVSTLTQTMIATNSVLTIMMTPTIWCCTLINV